MGKYRLSDIFTLQMGKTPSRNNADYWNNGDNNWVSISDLSTYSRYVDLTKETISDEGVKGSGIKAVPPDTVILSFKLSLGKVAITTQPVYTNEAIMAFIDKNIIEILPDYIFYLFSWMDWAAGTNKAVKGITLNKATLETYEINIPPITTQQKIADILDRANDLIEKRKSQIEKLDLLVKSQFVEMFGDPVMNPMGWEIRLLGSLGSLKNGMNYSQHDSGYAIKCLGVGDFGNLYKIDDMSKIKEISLSAEPSQDYLLQDKDIVFVRSNGNRELVGRSVEIFPQDTNLTFSGFCIRYRNESDDLLTMFLNHALHLPSMKATLLSEGRGANIQNVNQQMLSSLNIPIPPLDLQTQFATFVERVEAQKAQLKKSLALLELNYKSLMQKCFKGEIG